MKIIKSLLKISIPLTLVLIFISCGKSNVRNYKEQVPIDKTVHNFHGEDIGMTQTVTTEFKWSAPQGWILEKSKSKLRIATFFIRQNNKNAICTLIPLHGDGGGLSANVRMWYGTLTGKDISDTKLKVFLKEQKKFKTSSGYKGVLIDFLKTESKDILTSMLISIVTFPKKTLFIKLTGDKDILLSNRDKFISLSKSIEMVK
jgi:hypothetical protein